MEVIPLRVPATDGYELAATRFEPKGAAATVLINPATGVKQGYYARFARFLADRGFRVVTFDYRGVGGSAPPNLKRFDARMADWGWKDLEGMLRQLFDQHGTTPVHLVGHSVGGQVLGLAPSSQRLTRVVLVASQHGYWGNWPKSFHPRLLLLWRLILPSTSAMMGYFPAGWVGLGEPLPTGIAREWARWACHPDYLFGVLGSEAEAGYHALPGRILSISFEDDWIAPKRSVDRLAERFHRADVIRQHRSPKEFNVPQVGHFGYFRETFRPTLWQEAAEFLET